MENPKYVECKNCGTIHYVIDEAEAQALKDSGVLFDEFSNRNLKCCTNCGSKDKFIPITEEYMNEYSYDDKIPPILLDVV